MIIIKCKYTKYFNYIDNTFMFLIELLNFRKLC